MASVQENGFKTIKQLYGDNSFTTTIKENTVEFDSTKDRFTFNDPVEVPELRINGTEIVAFVAEDRAKLDSLQTPMQIKGRVDGIGDLPGDASVGDTYLVGLSGDGNFEEYVCIEVSGIPATPVWENLGHVKAQSDWNQSNNSSDNYILNKPAIKAGQGENSIIEGNIDNNVASDFSHAEGYITLASGPNSHAEGYYTTASGQHSHAEGNHTTASDPDSHAEGYITLASGESSHAEGGGTTASGPNSHAEGYYTTANHRSQHVFGEFTVADPSTNLATARGNYVEIVGKGTDNSNRSNARTLDWSGNEVLAGTITANGVNLNDELNLKQNALGFTPENVTNKKTSLAENSDTYYPTQKAVKTAVDAKADDTKVAAIQGLIPTQASPTNQLADKDFVNSSIGTSTAIFRGTFTSVDDLPTTGVDNNDYAFVKIFDSIQTDEVLRYDRYKWSDGWSFEYSLNNSSFTTAQWDAINSNATASIISDLLSHASNISNPHAVTKSQVGLGDVDNTSDLNKPLSTAAVTEFATKQDVLGFTPENAANKKTTLADNSDTYYPTQKAVKTAIDAKVEGPVSSTANDIPVYADETGKLLKGNTGVSILDGKIIAGGVDLNAAISELQQSQSDWNQTTSEESDYIKNKPAIKSGQGVNSIIEGDETTASGSTSHAEGWNTTASGNNSHAEGGGTTASRNNSHAEGGATTASGYTSHAEGNSTTASGSTSHAEGNFTTASGENSHTEGNSTTASGSNSHSEGSQTIANHKCQHVFGEYNGVDPSSALSSARGNYVEIVGNGVTSSARSNARTLDWQGNETLAGNLAVGGTITANGQEITPAEPQVQSDWNQNDSEAVDYIKNKPTTEPQVQADWNQNDSEAVDYIKNKPTISSTQTQSDWNQTTSTESDYILNKPAIKAGQGVNSTIEGDLNGNSSTGTHSHAEGINTTASGPQSHAEGGSTTAEGQGSHAEGASTKATGPQSHAEGAITTASGLQSHAEGASTTASGKYSHAEGSETTAIGDKSHAEGEQTQASGSRAHAEGYRTTAKNRSQHVFGEFNVLDPSGAASSNRGTYVEIVGKGADENTRSNARTLDWSGNEVLAGNLTIGGTITSNGQEITPAEPQVQADWNQTISTESDYIKNKPTIPAAQIQSDWTQSDNTKLDYIKNKPTLATVATSGSYTDLTNTPTIPSDGVDIVSPTASSSYTLTSDKYYSLETLGENTTITFTLPSAEKTGIYSGQFTMGSTVGTVTFPVGVTFKTIPVYAANKTYQFSIVNNLGVIVEF